MLRRASCGALSYDTRPFDVNQPGLVLAVPAMVDADPMASETDSILAAARSVLDEALEAGRRTTEGGKGIDEHQVHAERLAYAATELAAAEALAAYARARHEAGAGDALTDRMAAAFAAEVATRLRTQLEAQREDFGIGEALFARTLAGPEVA